MSGKGNRGFADLIAAGEGGQPAAQRLPPRTGVLAARNNRLAELASGQSVSRLHELVDPVCCRIWEAHNRDYAALDETTCADLIESMVSQGRQEVPAIVRRVVGVAGVEFEVVCGARRHWTVSWLREHGHPAIRFLVEPRELSDEEAFRISDLENRSRKDLSDYERASDYARAIDRYYDGSQQRMAERLHVSASWLSRYLELARLPPAIVAAFGSTAMIGISHAAKLAPLLRVPVTRKRMEETAVTLAAEQAQRGGSGRQPMPAAAVVAMLSQVRRPPARSPRRATVRDERGGVLLSGELAASGSLVISVPAPTVRAGAEALAAGVRKLLEQLE